MSAGKAFVRNVHIAVLKNNAVVLTVKLSSPSEVKVYYDTQKPSDASKLFRFWFNTISTGKRIKHRIVLSGAAAGGNLFFRLEKKTGAVQVSRLYHWRKNRPITVE